MIAHSTRRLRARTAIGAGLAVVMLAALGVAAPADALGTARSDVCRPFVAAKARVHAAATGREATLANLVTLLQARQDPWSMNAAQISALQDASSAISALDTKVQGGCYSTVAALRTDASPLWTAYRVYWLRVPQTHGILAADRLADARDRVAAAATKLATHVGSNAKAQSDLAVMNQALSVATTNLGTPPTANPAVAALATLAPAVDMSADVAAMETARGDLDVARAALVHARVQGLLVIADLGV